MWELPVIDPVTTPVTAHTGQQDKSTQSWGADSENRTMAVCEQLGHPTAQPRYEGVRVDGTGQFTDIFLHAPALHDLTPGLVLPGTPHPVHMVISVKAQKEPGTAIQKVWQELFDIDQLADDTGTLPALVVNLADTIATDARMNAFTALGRLLGVPVLTLDSIEVNPTRLLDAARTSAIWRNNRQPRDTITDMVNDLDPSVIGQLFTHALGALTADAAI